MYGARQLPIRPDHDIFKHNRTAGGGGRASAPLLADAPQDGPEQQREHAREHEARAVVGHVAPVALPELPKDERKLPSGRLRVARAEFQRLGARRRLAQLRDEPLVAPARQAGVAPVSARHVKDGAELPTRFAHSSPPCCLHSRLLKPSSPCPTRCHAQEAAYAQHFVLRRMLAATPQHSPCSLG